MPIAFRSIDDNSGLSPLPELTVNCVTDADVMARLQSRGVADIQRRFDDGHRAYVACVGGVPAAWGWVATRRASVGELQFDFDIPQRARYLWNRASSVSLKRRKSRRAGSVFAPGAAR